MLEIKNAVVVVEVVLICNRYIVPVVKKVDNFHGLWPSQGVIHDKIIRKLCFGSLMENIKSN